MKNPMFLLLNASARNNPVESFFSGRLSHLIKKSLNLLLILLMLPSASFAFDFNGLIDDVGNAVKSGANTVEESVKKVLPGDEKQQKQNPKEAAPRTQVKKTPPNTTPKKAFAAEDVQEDTQEEGLQTASTTKNAAPANVAKATKSASVMKSSAPVAVDTGGSVFSKDPINPETPPASVSTFSAGDKIYGMLKAAKPWKALIGSSDYLIVYFYIDGKQKVSKTVGLKRPDLLQRDYVIIDIAPDPKNMGTYADRDIIFPEKDGYKFGPELFTKYISELSPGKHTFRLEVKAYNKVYAAGEFSISGDDYSAYSSLLAAVKEGVGKQEKMPRAGMTNIALQNEMIALLKNAGWNDIRRLVIVDKDWWNDLVAGGNSAVKSRHIAAAAAAKAADGSYYYARVTFHQQRLISGGFGKMELTRTGEKKPILEQNIDD
ncbi:MAG: hypothetical protein KJ630_21450 [Proteobacteria bacterium]|nr:hypothetical protein [Pseudomonadota bacterium]